MVLGNDFFGKKIAVMIRHMFQSCVAYFMYVDELLVSLSKTQSYTILHYLLHYFTLSDTILQYLTLFDTMSFPGGCGKAEDVS